MRNYPSWMRWRGVPILKRMEKKFRESVRVALEKDRRIASLLVRYIVVILYWDAIMGTEEKEDCG